MNERLILAFESSADETSVAIVKNGNKIISLKTATQINSHQRFGGIVPEVASRHHIEEITKLINLALTEANITYTDLTAVAVTQGPGLVGSLLVGVNAAKTIAWAHDLPLIPVIHMAGHIEAVRFSGDIIYPSMALVISGGHTEFVFMENEYKYVVIGDTQDDAVGETYDKVGRTLGIKYPAGKIIDELSQKGKDTYSFPRPMINSDDYNFSFSGLKSSVINTIHNLKQKNKEIDTENICTSFQNAVIDVISIKTEKVLKNYNVKTFIIAGGVSANKGIRNNINKLMKDFPEIKYLPVDKLLTGDNAAMIGAAGDIAYRNNVIANININANPSLEFEYMDNII